MRPFRLIGRQLQRVKRLMKLVTAGIRSSGGVTGALVRAGRAYRRDGLRGLRRGLGAVENDWRNKPGFTPLSFSNPGRAKRRVLATDRSPPESIALSHAALSARRETPIPDDPGILKDPAKLVAFYLPQFHRIAENSEWWGPGFTEWTNVARGRPNFVDHYQPHIPRELGFYDLSNINVMREQADLARRYGVHGFCFYYYWFSGRRILERPLDNFLASDVDFPFCLCWANENWTRTWDGDNKSILLQQLYAEGDEERFIQSLMPFFEDPRYIKVDGRPMLLAYRVKEFPNPSASIAKWREVAAQLGLPGLHIAIVDFYDISDPREVGADALIEFPPHKFNGHGGQPNPIPKISNPNFKGGILDYWKIVAQAASRNRPNYALYRGIMPGWDNTARRQDTPTIVANNTPGLYGIWLRYLRSYCRLSPITRDGSFVFVNAWNEWGEGCHLEPDVRFGLQFLEETARSSWYDAAVAPQTLEEARMRVTAELQNYLDTLPPHTSDVAARPLMQKIDSALQYIPPLRWGLKFLYRILLPSKEPT
jgi:hypothetical protein